MKEYRTLSTPQHLDHPDSTHTATVKKSKIKFKFVAYFSDTKKRMFSLHVYHATHHVLTIK
jgi:hypothetical protein